MHEWELQYEQKTTPKSKIKGVIETAMLVYAKDIYIINSNYRKQRRNDLSKYYIFGIARVRSLEGLNEHNGDEVKAFGTVVSIASNGTNFYCLQLQDSTFLRIKSFMSHDAITEIDISNLLNSQVFIIGKLAKHPELTGNENRIDMPTIFHTGNITATTYIQDPLFISEKKELDDIFHALPDSSHHINIRGKFSGNTAGNNLLSMNDGTLINLHCADDVSFKETQDKEVIIAGTLSYSENTYALTECTIFDYLFFMDHFSKE